MTVELNEQNFDQEISNFSGVALVDFWAPWCGPCKMQGPLVDSLASDLKDKENVKIAKLNVDENTNLAQKFQVMSIPTLKVFKNGEVVEEMIGLQTMQVMADAIKKHLS